jgi:hypothetical protein
MSVYNEVHDLVYHGGGGYSYSEVYNMPIYLRRYSITRINNYLKEKKEAEEKVVNDAKNNRKW